MADGINLFPCPNCAEKIPVTARECVYCKQIVVSVPGAALRRNLERARSGDGSGVAFYKTGEFMILAFLVAAGALFYVLFTSHLERVRQLEVVAKEKDAAKLRLEERMNAEAAEREAEARSREAEAQAEVLRRRNELVQSELLKAQQLRDKYNEENRNKMEAEQQARADARKASGLKIDSESRAQLAKAALEELKRQLQIEKATLAAAETVVQKVTEEYTAENGILSERKKEVQAIEHAMQPLGDGPERTRLDEERIKKQTEAFQSSEKVRIKKAALDKAQKELEALRSKSDELVKKMEKLAQ